MIRTDKKRERAFEFANPDFSSAGVEVEGAFFVNFASRFAEMGGPRPYSANSLVVLMKLKE
jgi:hypothetical protein